MLIGALGAGAQTPRGKTAAAAPAGADEVPAELELFVGETRVLPSPNVARIAVGNGRLLSASVVDERDILLIANDAGATDDARLGARRPRPALQRAGTARRHVTHHAGDSAISCRAAAT